MGTDNDWGFVNAFNAVIVEMCVTDYINLFNF